MHEKWLGIFKVLEEMGELQQVLGKLGVFPSGNHPDGGGDLRVKLREECTDLMAALDYFMEINDVPLLVDRYDDKSDKFRRWGLDGVSSDE